MVYEFNHDIETKGHLIEEVTYTDVLVSRKRCNI